jgi:hypothetical protein
MIEAKPRDDEKALKIGNLVADLLIQHTNQIHEEVAALDWIDDKEKWLVVSRVIAAMYGIHFNMSMERAEKLEDPEVAAV